MRKGLLELKGVQRRLLTNLPSQFAGPVKTRGLQGSLPGFGIALISETDRFPRDGGSSRSPAHLIFPADGTTRRLADDTAPPRCDTIAESSLWGPEPTRDHTVGFQAWAGPGRKTWLPRAARCE